jgi:hypothetical protein
MTIMGMGVDAAVGCMEERGMSRKRFVVSVILMVTLAAGWVAYAQGGQTVSNVTKWEYRVEIVTAPNEVPTYLEPVARMKLLAENGEAFSKLMNRLGAEGWELTGIGASFFYFKRPAR